MTYIVVVAEYEWLNKIEFNKLTTTKYTFSKCEIKIQTYTILIEMPILCWRLKLIILRWNMNLTL